MIYNALLLLGYLFYGLLRRKWLKDPLGRRVPAFHGQPPVIWIHAVSVGETKAASTLIPHIQAHYPGATLALSTITETGYKLSETVIPEASLHFRLPLDLSFVMQRLVKQINPTLLILVEGDYWPNMLKACKQHGAKIVVVSGKLSERSTKGYALMPWILKHIDHFFVQNALYLERFQRLGLRHVSVAGNLKFDLKPQLYPLEVTGEWITLGSTHAGEEKAILDALKPVMQKRPHLHIFVAPRHPERFEEVRKLLLSYERVQLIDKMGFLPSYYRYSKLAIVGGSYNPKIGGHDILEPVRLGIPVLFGPYMHTQEELKTLIEASGVGESCELSTLSEKVDVYLEKPVTEAIKILVNQLAGAAKRTAEKIALVI